MEYWEGFFLGKYWTDSDYHDSRHRFLFLSISFVVFLLTVAKVIMPSKIDFLFPFSQPVHLVIGLVLLLVLPLIASKFYRMHPIVRVVILLLYCLQYFFLLISFVQFFADLLAIDFSTLPDLFLKMLDQIMVFSGNLFNFLGGLGSTIASVAGGIVIGGIIAVLAVLFSVFLPLVYLMLFRILQRCVDAIIYKVQHKRTSMVKQSKV